MALNTADEVAVELFLDRKICYYDIAELVCEVVRSAADENYKDYAQIAEADRAFREKTLELARKLPQPQPICD